MCCEKAVKIYCFLKLLERIRDSINIKLLFIDFSQKKEFAAVMETERKEQVKANFESVLSLISSRTWVQLYSMSN